MTKQKHEMRVFLGVETEMENKRTKKEKLKNKNLTDSQT